MLKTKLGPIPLRWVAEHVEYDPPHLFADRQVSGPFASWYHRHHFLDDGQAAPSSATRSIIGPLGLLGRTFGGGLVERKLRRMFDYRHEVTRRIVESGDFSPTK